MRSAIPVILAFLAGMILTVAVLAGAVAFLPGPVRGEPTPSPIATSAPSAAEPSAAPSPTGPAPTVATQPSGATASPSGPSGSPAGPTEAGPSASP